MFDNSYKRTKKPIYKNVNNEKRRKNKTKNENNQAKIWTHTHKKNLCAVPINRSYLPSYKMLIDRYDDLNFYTNIHVFSFRCC